MNIRYTAKPSLINMNNYHIGPGREKEISMNFYLMSPVVILNRCMCNQLSNFLRSSSVLSKWNASIAQCGLVWNCYHFVLFHGHKITSIVYCKSFLNQINHNMQSSTCFPNKTLQLSLFFVANFCHTNVCKRVMHDKSESLHQKSVDSTVWRCNLHSYTNTRIRMCSRNMKNQQ